jgi:branched-chain amino acid transport system substrate-binding protein
LSAASDTRAAALIAPLLGLVLAGCSLTTTEVSECKTNTDCRAGFGLGWTCASDGLCEQAPGNPRCTQTYPEDLFFEDEEHANTIVFGNLMDRSLATHRAREKSAQLAFRQVNEDGGLELRRFGMVFCTIEENSDIDFATRQEAAVSSANYLIDTLGVQALLGPAASDDVQQVFLNIKDRNILEISPSATSPQLTTLDPDTVSDTSPGLLWRTAPPDSLQGAAIAYDMRNPGLGRTEVVDTVAVIYQTGAYGEALAAVFAEEFVKSGGTPTLLPYSDDGERAEKTSEAALGSYDEVLFISSQTREVIEFMDAAAGLPGYDNKGIFLSDSAANPDLLMEANPARFPQVRGTRQAPRDENVDLVYAAFIAAYASEFGEDVRPFSFTANSFDAAWMLAYGTAWALLQEGEVTGPNIARGLRKLSSGPDIEIRPTTWNQVVERFRAGDSVNIAGASGNLDYDPETEETSGTIETWQISGGQIVGIDTWPPSM